MFINYKLIIRLCIVGAIGVISFLILSRLITWPEKSKAKRTGQIVDNTAKEGKKILKIYILVWILLIAAGAAAIMFL